MDVIRRYTEHARLMNDRQLMAQNQTMREILDYPPRNIEEEMARQIARDSGYANWRDAIEAARIIWKRHRRNKRLF